MGRHHVRVANTTDGVELVGGVDPAGDVHGALVRQPLFTHVEDVIEAGIDAAVVAVPSEDHEKVALRLADAGVHTLLEKPLASDLESASAIRNAFAGTGLTAGVGHVERYNPAIQALADRLAEGEIGEVISISTRRAGPHPSRVTDIGVVLDLATHDIDLVHWLGGPLQSLKAEVVSRFANGREDLVEVIGRLRDGGIASLSVNWLTPTKERRVMVLGEGGAFVADLVTADLTLFSNADVPMEWDAMARLKGVSEGDMIRYALPKPEPLRTQLEEFRDAIMGRRDVQLVTLDEGVGVLATAHRILESATA